LEGAEGDEGSAEGLAGEVVEDAAFELGFGGVDGGLRWRGLRGGLRWRGLRERRVHDEEEREAAGGHLES
jgi:hypothetical protein